MTVPTTASLTIATVAYESAGVIGGWLDSVAEFAPGAQVVVVDHASSDGSAGIARSHASSPVVVDSGGNLGFGRGCNLAAENADRPFIWFLNPDARIVTVDQHALAAELENRPFGIRETAERQESGELDYDVFAHRGEWAEWFTHVMTPLWPRILGSAPGSLKRGYDWASGASMLVRAEEFRELDGFDPSLFLLYEDRELCWRAAKAGLPIGTTAAIITSHTPGGSSSAPGLGTGRRAWALLSWVEYVAATQGDQRAEQVARRILGALRASETVGRTIAPAGENRLSRRLTSASHVRQAMCEALARSGAEGFYVRAVRAVKATGECG